MLTFSRDSDSMSRRHDILHDIEIPKQGGLLVFATRTRKSCTWPCHPLLYQSRTSPSRFSNHHSPDASSNHRTSPSCTANCTNCWYPTPNCSIHAREVAACRHGIKPHKSQPQSRTPRAFQSYSPYDGNLQLLPPCRVPRSIPQGADVPAIPVP